MSTESPFRVMPRKEPGFGDRILGRPPKENAIVLINNLLAQAGLVRHVSRDEIDQIAVEHRVNLQRDFPDALRGFYRTFLEHCLADKAFSEQELRDLSHLKHLLGLDERAIEAVHNEVAQSVYSQSLDDALADGRLSPEEKEFLERLQRALQMPKEIADRLHTSRTQDHVQKYLDGAISDRRLSPEEDQELARILESLGAQVNYDNQTKATLDKFRYLWVIENGDLPEISPGISLPRNEKCYYCCEVKWHEYRRVTRRVRYGGPTVRFRIARGVYWSAGDLGVQVLSEDLLTLIDSGRALITNKRLIFMGGHGNKSILLSKILDIEPYKNGVEIQKAAGKNPFLEFGNEVEVFTTILERAIRDAN